MSRLGIFVFYDEEGVVEKYVEYLVGEIRNNVDDLFVVSNCILPENSKKIFLKFTDKVLERDNRGFDGGAYKDILCNVIGLDNCVKWDELLLANDTFYGPFCSLSSIFEKMDESHCDFWGLSVHGDSKVDEQFIIRQHIQSYFLVIRSNLLWSDNFAEFWLNMKEADSLYSAIENFEMAFTQYFLRHGFIYDVLVNVISLEGRYPRNGMNWTYWLPYEMIAEYGLPILKKKALVNSNSFQTKTINILNYIKYNTNYDTDMIWEDLLRKNSAYHLISKLNLIYVVDDEIKQNANNCDIEKAVLIFKIDNLNSIEELVLYLNMSGKVVNTYIWTENFDLVQSINGQCSIEQIYYCSSREESYLFWKKISEKYNYIGYIHLKAVFNDNYFVDYLLRNNLRDNLIKSKQYVCKICRLMDEENLLGVVLPPLNRYGFEEKKYIWGEDAFWLKSTCLNAICKNVIDKNGQWLPEMARKVGFYSAIVEADEYARTELLELNQMLYEQEQKGFFQTPHKYIEEFWMKHTKRYIYGTGKIAERFTRYLWRMGWDQYDGYIVTKRESTEKLFYGKKVWQFDELPEEEIGIVVAMNNKNTKEVLSGIKNKKGTHCFILMGMEI